MTPKQISLQAALQDFGLRELPKELQPNEIWITAIGLVTKGCGSEYVKLTNENDAPVVKKDYGTCSAILKIEKIFPVDKLDKRFVPDLRSNKAIIEFLSKNGYAPNQAEALLSKDNKTPEQIQEDRAKVKKAVTSVAIKLAKQTLAEEKRCRNIGRIKSEDDGEE